MNVALLLIYSLYYCIDKGLLLFYDQENLVYKINVSETIGGFINEHDVEMVW